MSAKEPVLLIVLIETASLRWYVAGIGLTGEATPLLTCEAGQPQSLHRCPVRRAGEVS